MSKHKQRGWTSTELAAVILGVGLILVWLAVVVGIGYVALHFILKFW